MAGEKTRMQKIVAKEKTTLLTLLTGAGYSRTKVKQLIKYRALAVNDLAVTRPDHALLPGDAVTLKAEQDASAKTVQCPGLEIVFEDEDIIVIDKPAGLLTIASATEKVKTAFYKLTAYLKERSGGKDRLFIVHRLDQGTSGLLVFAKNETVKRTLQGRWEEANKKYRVVVEGVPRQKSGKVSSYLRETKALRVYSVDSDNGEGKYAETGYEMVKASDKYALLEITLFTGRKNQIRVHMADLGHPVAGDKKYGAKTDPLKRLCLHACFLAFPHPTTDKLLEFTSQMPARFEALFHDTAGGKK